MFSIYGLSGQLFRGTLEEMNRVRALERAKSARTVARDDDDRGIDAEAGRSHEEAVQAYRAMLPREIERGPLYHADQIMQRRVITVADSDDVAQAWRTLRDHRIHQAPVLDDSAQLVGIVSERDLLTALNIDAGRIIEAINRRVLDVMTTPVIATAPVTDIRRIAAVMLEHGVDGVPITNDRGRLVGFVSRSDILRAVVTDPPLSLWR
ncbi:MAG: CBS domain-containing protein [Sulfurimicrobium sp.]|jgi:CBS domain-containing protein|nr:CBS domain-containing protein [Sulfurimicrobium sp.]MDO9188255.1 CBS domain-containing protein [Sulfurimicrobium sp.]MDP1704625.1 CBS domain-containing protein [Sulfurimicrobium sp.]MDP2197172.1 CBS domain-containing protein [Sulfurimicrobium sp.]MDP2963251.1 CBS domain-containing protein [Sulfurimicrobium sp.]